MEVACQCGLITFTTPLPEPLALYHCHCLECQKQTASAFGTSAKFPAFALSEENKKNLGVWTRPTDAGNTSDCYFCKNCGVRLIHAKRGGDSVSVKGGLVKGLDWTKAVHIWTKRAVVPIPEGAKQFEGEPPQW